DGIRDFHVTGVQTCALPILSNAGIIQLSGDDEPPAPTLSVHAPAGSGPTEAGTAPGTPPGPTATGSAQPAKQGPEPEGASSHTRSEERRVGKEWRAPWARHA